MKTSQAKQQTSKLMMVLTTAAIISIFTLGLSIMPTAADRASDRERDQQIGKVVEQVAEVDKDMPIEQHDTELAQGYVRAAQAYADLFEYEDGLPWAEEAIRLDPTLSEAHLIYGYLRFKLVHSEEAIAAFERCIELDPNTFEAYLYLGIIYRGAGDLDQGFDNLNQAMEVARTSEELSTAYAERGLAYGVMDRFEESFDDFDAALTINPDNGWAIFYQGIVTQKVSDQENVSSDLSEGDQTGGGLGFGS